MANNTVFQKKPQNKLNETFIGFFQVLNDVK